MSKAVDNGQVVSVEEAHDAFWEGNAMEFLDQYNEIDLHGFNDESSDLMAWDTMNDMFQQYMVDDPYDLSVGNNGLAYVTAQIAELIQHDV